ncbi:MAG: fused MFS/spermidine synthase, partial [Candidatus Aminicenantales bacterium]
RTLYIISGMLIVLALLLAPFAFTRASVAVVLLFVAGIAGSEASSYYLWRTHELYDTDSEYSRIRVFRSTDQKTGRDVRVIATDPYYVQSSIYLDSDELAFRYTPFYHLIRHFRPDFARTLMIGGAGYSFPRDYLRTYPRATMDVVEIDPRMTEIAKEFFRLEDDPRAVEKAAREKLGLAAPGEKVVVEPATPAKK